MKQFLLKGEFVTIVILVARKYGHKVGPEDSSCRLAGALLYSCLVSTHYSLLHCLDKRSGVGIYRRKTSTFKWGLTDPLQLLDDSAQERDGATWAVDNPDLAEIQKEDGLIVLHAKAVGTVVVTAMLGQRVLGRPQAMSRNCALKSPCP